MHFRRCAASPAQVENRQCTISFDFAARFVLSACSNHGGIFTRLIEPTIGEISTSQARQSQALQMESRLRGAHPQSRQKEQPSKMSERRRTYSNARNSRLSRFVICTYLSLFIKIRKGLQPITTLNGCLSEWARIWTSVFSAGSKIRGRKTRGKSETAVRMRSWFDSG